VARRVRTGLEVLLESPEAVRGRRLIIPARVEVVIMPKARRQARTAIKTIVKTAPVPISIRQTASTNKAKKASAGVKSSSPASTVTTVPGGRTRVSSTSEIAPSIRCQFGRPKALRWNTSPRNPAPRTIRRNSPRASCNPSAISSAAIPRIRSSSAGVAGRSL
jgi:hypothetical protein